MLTNYSIWMELETEKLVLFSECSATPFSVPGFQSIHLNRNSCNYRLTSATIGVTEELRRIIARRKTSVVVIFRPHIDESQFSNDFFVSSSVKSESLPHIR